MNLIELSRHQLATLDTVMLLIREYAEEEAPEKDGYRFTCENHYDNEGVLLWMELTTPECETAVSVRQLSYKELFSSYVPIYDQLKAAFTVLKGELGEFVATTKP